MDLTVLGNSGGVLNGSLSTAMLLNDNVLIDCGTGMLNLSPEQTAGITDVLITHSHMDHISMLPFLIDYKIGSANSSVRVHCNEETADSLRRYVFNDHIWPNLEAVEIGGVPIVQMNVLKPFERINIAGAEVTPVPVIHQVPTLGFCLHGQSQNFMFLADIFDAEPETWDFIGNLSNFSEMTMEVSFPNAIRTVAQNSFHLTPDRFRLIVDKYIPENVHLHYCHIKPRYAEDIIREMGEIMGERASPLEVGQHFNF